MRRPPNATGARVPIHFSCPQCNRAYIVQDHHAGKKTACKQCKTEIRIPTPQPPIDELEVLPVSPVQVPTLPCPHCGTLLPPNTVLCTRCFADPRAPRRRGISPRAGLPAPLAKLLKNPLVYVALGALALLVVLMTSHAPAVAIGLSLVLLGAVGGLVGNLYFGFSMYKAVYQEHGILPILGLFVPIVSFFVGIWMIITYWHFAWRAFASVIVGVLVVMVGLFLSSDRLRGFQGFSIAESVPVFPALPPATPLEPGIDRHLIQLDGTGPATDMRIQLYMPASARNAPPQSLPCILIAPAGTTMLTGIRFSHDDSAEHLAYVRRGFAVATFDLDGALANDPTDREFINAVRAFRNARHGITNARHTLDYLLAKVPAIDPKQLFAVGHSSAGGLALNVAAADPRIKAVVAYAPSTDILSRQPPQLIRALKRSIYDIESFARNASPISHVQEIHCPVFIFHAADDDVISGSEIHTFLQALRDAGKTVELKTVPSGGHYDAMIRQGIPMGITWLAAYAPATAEKVASPADPPLPRPAPPVPSPIASAVPPPEPTPPPPSPIAPVERPRPTPAASRTPPIPAAPDVFEYDIPAPVGFTRVESNDPNVHTWTKQKSGRAVKSEYTVSLRKAGPFPERYPANAYTIEAGPLVFRQSRTSSAQFTRTVVFTCRDGDCLITLSATRDESDSDAAAAMTNAARKITRLAAPVAN